MSKTLTKAEKAALKTNAEIDTSIEDIFKIPEGAIPASKSDMALHKFVKYELLGILKSTKGTYTIKTKHHEGDLQDTEVTFGVLEHNAQEVMDSIIGKAFVLPANEELETERKTILFLPYDLGKSSITWIADVLY